MNATEIARSRDCEQMLRDIEIANGDVKSRDCVNLVRNLEIV